MVQGHHRVQTRRDPHLVRRVNAHIRNVFSQLTYTASQWSIGWAIIPCLYIRIRRMTVPLRGKLPWVILWGGNCLPVPYFVQMGLLVLNGYVRGVIYYGDTLWILDMGSCLTLLGRTCL